MYLLILFPCKTDIKTGAVTIQEDTASIIDGWKMTGKYDNVLPKQMPLWSDGNNQYRLFCIQRNRIYASGKTASIDRKENILNSKETGTVFAIADSPTKWLEKNGYKRIATGGSDEKLL